MPVQVRAIEGLPIPGSDEIAKAFREDTRTLIVFQHGGVLRMATKVKRGQMLAVTHMKTGQEVPCRVVNVRSSGPTEEYVEVEFTQRVAGFWGIHFPSDPLNEQAEAALEKPESDNNESEAAKRAHAARVEARVEAEAIEADRQKIIRAETEKLAAEQEARATARFAADEKAAAERLEAARLAEQVAAQRAEAERIANQNEAKRREAGARREAEREAELAEQQRLAEMRTASEKMAEERAEAQRVAAERAAQEIAAKERQRAAKLEAEEAAKKQAEAEARVAAEKLAAERAEAARLAAEHAAREIAAKERERIEKLETEKADREKAQADARAAREKKQQEIEETRAILAKLEAERRTTEFAAAERATQEKSTADSLAKEKIADTVLGYGLSAPGLPSVSQERAESARGKAAREQSEATRSTDTAAAAEKAARRVNDEAAKQLADENASKARAEKEHKALVARLEKERLRSEKAAAAKIEAEEKKAAKQLKAETRATRRSGAAVANTLFGNAGDAAEITEVIESKRGIGSESGVDGDNTLLLERPEDSRGANGKRDATEKTNVAVFGSLNDEIAHDRNELRAHAKSRSGMGLAIAAGVLMIAGGGAWWFLLGPGVAAREKAAQTNSVSSTSQLDSPAASPGAASPTASSGSVATQNTLSSPALPSGAVPAGAKLNDGSSSTLSRPYGATETRLSGASNDLAKSASAGSLGTRDARSIETSSRVKDALPPAAIPSEPVRTITARPALDATLRAPVRTNSGIPARTADSDSVPDVRGASTVMNGMNGAETTILGGRSVSANAIAPPPPMGGNVVTGRLLKSVPPQFPDIARQRHVDGDVVVRADVDASGNVVTASALSGPDVLRPAALTSVKQWKYSPALLNGQAVPMQVQITVKFRNTK